MIHLPEVTALDVLGDNTSDQLGFFGGHIVDAAFKLERLTVRPAGPARLS